jgi:hypothetical protein
MRQFDAPVSLSVVSERAIMARDAANFGTAFGRLTEEARKRPLESFGTALALASRTREDEPFARISECPDEAYFFPSSRNVYPNPFAFRFP